MIQAEIDTKNFHFTSTGGRNTRKTDVVDTSGIGVSSATQKKSPAGKLIIKCEHVRGVNKVLVIVIVPIPILNVVLVAPVFIIISRSAAVAHFL